MAGIATESRVARETTEARARRRQRRPIRLFFLLVLIMVGAALADFRLLPNSDAAISAVAAELLFLILFVTAWDLVAMIFRERAYLDWLPQHPLPPWLGPIRSSLIVISFVYGILLGHYFWQ